jgi:hypothetical protein
LDRDKSEKGKGTNTTAPTEGVTKPVRKRGLAQECGLVGMGGRFFLEDGDQGPVLSLERKYAQILQDKLNYKH